MSFLRFHKTRNTLGALYRSPPKACHGLRSRLPKFGRPLSTQGTRALKALLIMVVALAILTGLSFEPSPETKPMVADENQMSLTQAILASIKTAEPISFGEKPLPQWFEQEFFSTDGFIEGYANEDETVLMLTSSQPSAITLTTIVRVMEAKGWTAITSGLDNVVSLIKKSGDHTWALLWSEDVENQSTITIQTFRETPR